MHWHVGPYVWVAAEDAQERWEPPAGSLAALDLRTLPEMSVAGGAPGKGLFLTSSRLGADYDYLGAGSWYDLKPTTRQRRALAFRVGQTAAGDDLVGMVFSLFSDEADPQGLDRPKPLMPVKGGRIELHVGQRHAELWRWNRGRGANRVKSLLRHQFAELMADAEAGRLKDAIHHRRVLDAWCEKYGVEEWQEFVPDALQPLVSGRVPHDTTLGPETFTGTDFTSLGPVLSWSDLTLTHIKQSNMGRSDGSNGNHLTQVTTDLSSSDQSADFELQVGANAFMAGPVCRCQSGPTGYYAWFNNGHTYGTQKIVSGTPTTIASGSKTDAAGDILKTQIIGSTLKGFYNGSEDFSNTDTSISSGTRVGVYSFVSEGTPSRFFDNFNAQDETGGGGGITYTQLERGIKGYCRGMYVGRI